MKRSAPGSRLYVGNLPYDATEEEVRALFAEHRVTEVRVMVDRETGQGRGFGFVGFFSADDAEAARVAVSGASLGGRVLRVNVAEERRQ